MQPRVIVGTNHGLYELGERQELRLEGHRVSALVRQGGSQWAVIDDTAIWRATDGGEWQQVADSGSQRVNCILPQEGCALVGTADAHLFILRNGELSRIHAFDEAPGRDTWTTPSGAPPDTRSLAIDADGVIYANVHVGGLCALLTWTVHGSQPSTSTRTSTKSFSMPRLVHCSRPLR